VVVEIFGVAKVVPVLMEAPPEDAVYQSITPPVEAVADNATVPEPHLEAGVVAVMEGRGFTVRVAVAVVLEQNVNASV
jgi:hypothetical protein